MGKTILAGSVCIRCNKQRIISKTWTNENARGTPITHVEAVCPDAECQKLVDAFFAEKRERKLKFAK